MALCFIASCWGISCSSSRKQAAGLETTDSRFSGMVPTPASSGRISSSVQAAPPVVIYKTAKDYSRHVCGNRYQYKDLVKELNERIRSGEFKVSL